MRKRNSKIQKQDYNCFSFKADAKESGHGSLGIDPGHPQHFIYEDGTPFFLIGFEADWLFALDLNGDKKLPKTKRFIDDITANGFNQIVMNVYAHDVEWKEDGKVRSTTTAIPPCTSTTLWPGIRPSATSSGMSHKRL